MASYKIHIILTFLLLISVGLSLGAPSDNLGTDEAQLAQANSQRSPGPDTPIPQDAKSRFAFFQNKKKKNCFCIGLSSQEKPIPFWHKS